MTTQHDKAKRWQFGLRDILWCVLLVAITSGWFADRQQLFTRLSDQRVELDAQREELAEWDQKMLQLHWMAHSNPPPTIDSLMRKLGVATGGRILPSPQD